MGFLIQRMPPRKCAKCGVEASSATPLHKGSDGKKYCEVCHVPDIQFITRQKRDYYLATWGWDPEVTKIPLTTIIWKWEQFFPLENDPAIHATGVEIGARVEVYPDYVNSNQHIRGRVVFRRNDHDLYHNYECTVDCTHVAVATLATDQLPADQREFAKTTEGHAEIKLDPEEHFVALRSYVQGIAEIGLENMFAAKYPDDPLSLPFGFNSLMQKQVLRCLTELCPNAAKSILYKAVGYIIETAPVEWIQQRDKANLLNEAYDFTKVLKDHAFWMTLPEDLQKKVVAILGSHTSSDITQSTIVRPTDQQIIQQIQEADHVIQTHFTTEEFQQEYFLQPESARIQLLSARVGASVAQLHEIGITEENIPVQWEHSRDFLRLVDERINLDHRTIRWQTGNEE